LAGAWHRYRAACAAEGGARPFTIASPEREGRTLADEERARLRGQARGWLEAELGAWGKVLESADAEKDGAVAKTLQWWQEDAVLARVQGEAIEDLPEGQRAAWRALWAEVDSLLARTKLRATEPTGNGAGGVLPVKPFAR
jgi:hypothetical protein